MNATELSAIKFRVGQLTFPQRRGLLTHGAGPQPIDTHDPSHVTVMSLVGRNLLRISHDRHRTEVTADGRAMLANLLALDAERLHERAMLA